MGGLGRLARVVEVAIGERSKGFGDAVIPLWSHGLLCLLLSSEPPRPQGHVTMLSTIVRNLYSLSCRSSVCPKLFFVALQKTVASTPLSRHNFQKISIKHRNI
jgi:hypothetical protein